MRDADAALLFDFNGVIVDDEEQHRLALEEVLAEEGIALTREQYYSDYLGYDDRMSLVAAFQHAGRPLPAVRVGRLVAEKSRRYERLLEGSLTLVPGASEFVTRAADRFRLGVPLPARRCVAIEDSLPGLAAARAAGIRCAMLATSHPPDALADADVVWPSFSGHDPAELLELGEA